MLVRFLIFGLLGLIAAVVVSATKRSISSKRLELTGEASLVLFPIFGLIAVVFPFVAVRANPLPWYVRGLAYMTAFFIVQYIAGFILTKMNRCPWSYSGKGSLGGLVHVSDAPLFFGAGLAVEWLYPWIKAASIALG